VKILLFGARGMLVAERSGTSDTVARATLRAAPDGYPRPVLETPDIDALGAA